MTMDADMATGVGTATEIPMKTALSTMDTPLTGMTNTPVSKWTAKINATRRWAGDEPAQQFLTSRIVVGDLMVLKLAPNLRN